MGKAMLIVNHPVNPAFWDFFTAPKLLCLRHIVARMNQTKFLLFTAHGPEPNFRMV